MKSIIDAQQSMLARMQQFAVIAEGRVSPAAIDGAGTSTGTGSIGATFAEVLRSVDADQHRASAAMAAVDSGRSTDLVGAMIESQKASVSFSALLQVRNKLATAFDDIMKMPI